MGPYFQFHILWSVLTVLLINVNREVVPVKERYERKQENIKGEFNENCAPGI